MYTVNLRSAKSIEPNEVLTDSLSRSDNAPVPTWQQLTRSNDPADRTMLAHVVRIIGGTDAAGAFEIWESWSSSCRRSFAVVIDKICNEGWLDCVGPIDGFPWDGGFFFRPCTSAGQTIDEILDVKAERDGVYTRCELRSGLAAYLSRWNHKGWRRGWIENDTPFGSLHVGIFENGIAEVHLDLFNPLYTNGAPPSDITKVPCIGAYNHRLFRLHRKWEGSNHGSLTRTSANFYLLMRGLVPFCF